MYSLILCSSDGSGICSQCNSQITDSPTKIFGNKQKTTENNRYTMGNSTCEKRINKKNETQNTEKNDQHGFCFLDNQY